MCVLFFLGGGGMWFSHGYIQVPDCRAGCRVHSQALQALIRKELVLLVLSSCQQQINM
jgi:hypothetical protein